MPRRKLDKDTATALAALGHPDRAIAAKTGVCRDTARRQRAGAPSGRAAARAARLKRVAELHALGLSDGEIAKKTGRKAASAAAKDRIALNLPANFRGPRRVGA